ncbi:MAG: type VI secretion system Vgr family protein [Myxococcota bacterium]
MSNSNTVGTTSDSSSSTRSNELLANQADFTFGTPSLPSSTFRVSRFTGREELSHPFEFQLSLISAERELNLQALIGEPAVLEIRGKTGTRRVMGVIERFQLVVAGRRFTEYQAILVPAISLLRYTRNARIFQQKTTLEIVQAVMQSAQLPLETLHPALMSAYTPRDFCVQYQESDFDFISRLLEEDGIFYFFDHSGERPVWVLGDGPHAIAELAQVGTVAFRDESHETVLHEEAVYELRGEASIFSGASVLRDFRFKHPNMDLEASRKSEQFSQLETYYYPGGYVSPELGQTLARIRLEQQSWERSRFTGSATVRALVPGFSVKLEGHARADFNQPLLMVSLVHHGVEQQARLEDAGVGQQEARAYSCHFVAIPVNIPYRPALRTPRPNIAGMQTAIVTGPVSEEIYCDEHGRVKVHFHWDRQGSSDQSASCWIRVSQSWGGGGFGAIFVPRVGQEVLVQFLEGDPDRPYVVGVFYNGQNQPPYPLPGGRTRTGIRSRSTPGGGGFNELRFEDVAGSEEVFLHAQQDMNTVVKRDHSQQYGRDRQTDVGRNNSKKVGLNESVQVGNNQQVVVGTDQYVAVGANQAVTVSSNQAVVVGADQSTVVGANQTLKVAVNQDVQIGAARSLNVTGNDSTSIQGDRSTSVQGDQSNVVQGNEQRTIVGSATEQVAGILQSSVGEYMLNSAMNTFMSAGVSMTSVTPVYAVEAASSFSLTVGASSLTATPGNMALSSPDISLTGKFKITESVGASKILLENGGIKVTSAAGDVTVSAVSKITLQCGASSIVIDPGTITIQAPLVKLNC